MRHWRWINWRVVFDWQVCPSCRRRPRRWSGAPSKPHQQPPPATDTGSGGWGEEHADTLTLHYTHTDPQKYQNLLHMLWIVTGRHGLDECMSNTLRLTINTLCKYTVEITHNHSVWVDWVIYPVPVFGPCVCPPQVVDIMRVNVDKVLERDQKLSELDDRADALQAGASQFETSAAKLKNKYWWKNAKVRATLR